MRKYHNVEWKVIKNLRNKIVHDYEGINLNLIWDILKNDLSDLRKNLENIINKNKID